MGILNDLFKKIFNSDKKYYLELDENQDSEVVQNVVETATEVAESIQKVTSATTAEKPAETKPVVAKAKTKSVKATPKSSKASSYEPPFWVAAMYNNNNNNGSGASNNGATSELETFATDNLMPTVTKYRRRPGNSLNKFKDMAKNVRTSRR